MTNPADSIQLPAADPAAPTPAAVRRLGHRLSTRDVAIVRDVAALGLLTAGQLQRLRFAEDGSALTCARRCRRVLQRLTDRGLVARLDRRIGGVRAGSGGYIYRATPTARRLLGLPGAHGGRARGYDEPAPARTAHTLATAELAVRLVEDHRAGRGELVVFQAEPASWRAWTGPAGEPLSIRPDAFAVVAAGAWEHLAFLEVDLATEHVGTLARKVDAYRRYHAAGIEQAQHAAFPRVVFLAPDPARRTVIRHALDTDHDPLVTVADPADRLAGLTAATGKEAES